ncbi:hypothetical protein CP532_7026 [Ophiocordyceps camponoti-leonardi (nom. inval.)]|nr:hypothetical protein CP532_7026 [Ophiocordyceps camponoti-leonardi (nom. inval.)]
MNESEAPAKPVEAEQVPQISADEKPQSVTEKPQIEEEHQPIKAEPDSEEKGPQSIKAEPESEDKKPFIKAESESEEKKLEAVKSEPESDEKKSEAIESRPDSEKKSVEVIKTETKSEDAKTEQMKGSASHKDDADTTMIRTKAKIDFDNRRNNRKFDPSVREVTDDPVAIRKQVEFYFGDWNFPQDKFMWQTCEGTANKPMPISKIHSFKRMRTFQPYSAVVAALRESSFLEVTGDEGKELVKRKVAYKPMAEARAKAEAATVYVKGFGDENPDTQFDLESFFAKYGEIKGLKLRRTNEGLFKGSVFVTFPDEEAAKKFIEMDPAPTYKGHELKIMFKRDYCEEKSELIRQGKIEPNGQTRKRFFEGGSGTKRGGKRDNRHDGHHDSGDWKKRREEDQKNGFHDRRDGGRGRGARGRDRGRGRGRGRGAGRGGRDGAGKGRDSRREEGERRDDTNEYDRTPAVDDDENRAADSFPSAKPRIQSTKSEDTAAPVTAGVKRPRDEDGAAPTDVPPAKKVDVKEEVKVEQT